MVVTAKDGKHFSADARLTVKADKNYTYSKNAADRFVIPLEWSKSETVSVSLESELSSQKGIEYSVEVKLCVGDELKNASSQPQAVEYEIGASQDITLKVANTTEPSLKIDGTQKVLKRTDELDLNVTMRGVYDGTVYATIQRKEADGYEGNFLDADVNAGNNQFSLGGITEAGSYW